MCISTTLMMFFFILPNNFTGMNVSSHFVNAVSSLQHFGKIDLNFESYCYIKQIFVYNNLHYMSVIPIYVTFLYSLFYLLKLFLMFSSVLFICMYLICN